MDIGISTACFYPEVLTEDTMKIIADMGFKTLEVFLETESEYNEYYCKRLKEKAMKYGLKVHSVHPFAIQYEPFLFDRYPLRRKDAYGIFLKVVKAAGILGAKYITFHGPSRKRFSNDNSRFAFIAAEMDSLAEIAAEHGLLLAWENVYWCLSQDPDVMQRVISCTENPDIHFTLDLKQANRSGVTVEHYLKIMGGKLATVHINDYSSDDMCLLPGRGQVEFAELFKLFREYGYKGPYIIEVYRDNFDRYEELTEAKDFLIATGRGAAGPVS